jgi:hypothetical protein
MNFAAMLNTSIPTQAYENTHLPLIAVILYVVILVTTINSDCYNMGLHYGRISNVSLMKSRGTTLYTGIIYFVFL